MAKQGNTGIGSSKKAKRRSAKAGLPPGTLIYIGERKTDHVRLTLIQYRDGVFNQQELKSADEDIRTKLKELKRLSRKSTVTLVYAARDKEHNQALVLKEVIDSLR